MKPVKCLLSLLLAVLLWGCNSSTYNRADYLDDYQQLITGVNLRYQSCSSSARLSLDSSYRRLNTIADESFKGQLSAQDLALIANWKRQYLLAKITYQATKARQQLYHDYQQASSMIKQEIIKTTSP